MPPRRKVHRITESAEVAEARALVVSLRAQGVKRYHRGPDGQVEIEFFEHVPTARPTDLAKGEITPPRRPQQRDPEFPDVDPALFAHEVA